MTKPVFDWSKLGPTRQSISIDGGASLPMFHPKRDEDGADLCPFCGYPIQYDPRRCDHCRTNKV